MSAILKCSVLSFLLAATPSLCCALEEIELVTQERAKELGLEIKSSAAGPDHVVVLLEFETKGELKDYSLVVLEMREEEKLLLQSTLGEEKSQPGRVVVRFYADRNKLDKLTMKVVVEYSDGGAGRVGHVLRVKEFVDLKKLR